MKIFVVLSVSRQIGGDYVFIRTEKAVAEEVKANEYLQTLKSQYVNSQGEMIPISINTPHGDVPCLTEVGVFEVELEN